jgi:hypothetical protein
MVFFNVNDGGMNLEMEKKCELQHHFILFFKIIGFGL